MKVNKDGLVEITLECDYPNVGKKGDIVYLDPKRAKLVGNLMKSNSKGKSVKKSFRVNPKNVG